MAKVRFKPIGVAPINQEDLAIANVANVRFPEESMWVTTSDGDLTVSSIITGRMGSWVSRFNLNALDTPPLIEWQYAPGDDNDARVVLQDEANRAQLRVSNLDIQPRPQAVYPDIHWVKNGLDIVPRSTT